MSRPAFRIFVLFLVFAGLQTTLTAGAVTDTDVLRLAGGERIATSIAISQDLYPEGLAAGAVLARADVPADALVATSLAQVGPLLLSRVESLPGSVGMELQRALNPGSRVYLAGGARALSENVARAVSDLGFDVVRLGGRNRFETATIVARAARSNPREVYLADGGGFVDALLAGAAAGQSESVVILSDGSTIPPETLEYLQGIEDVPVVGVGTKAIQTGVVDVAVGGETGFETSASMAS